MVGHKREFRQTFVGGSYALLDTNQNPLPVQISQTLADSVSIPIPLFPGRTTGCLYCTRSWLVPKFSMYWAVWNMDATSELMRTVLSYRKTFTLSWAEVHFCTHILEFPRHILIPNCAFIYISSVFIMRS